MTSRPDFEPSDARAARPDRPPPSAPTQRRRDRRGGFDVDEVEDVKIAIEELAAALVGVANGDPVMHVDIALPPGDLARVGRRRLVDPAQPIELDEFVPTILEALVDGYSFEASGDEARFHFEKHLRDR